MTSLLLWSLGISLGVLGVISDGQRYYGGCDGSTGSGPVCGSGCANVQPAIKRSLSEAYTEGQLFINFLPFSDLGLQLDNICFTFFQVTGSTDYYVFYMSSVYQNGTNSVLSFLITQDTLGVFRSASPDCGPFNDTVIGQDQCKTYVNYRCYPCEGCPNRIGGVLAPVYGLSLSHQQIPESCLQQSLRVIQANGVPPQGYIPLPMKLPSACVTRQDCVNYPTPCSG